MTAYFWDDSGSTSGAPMFTLADGDSLTAVAGSTMFGGDASPISLASNNYVRIDGAVYATSFAAIFQVAVTGPVTPSFSPDAQIVIGSAGLVSSGYNAIDVSADALILNAGEISALNTAVIIHGVGSVSNSGKISTPNVAISFGANSYLFNSGEIHGGSVVNATFSDGISIVNSGLMAGDFQAIGIGFNSNLHNSGEINGGAGTGVAIGSGTLINSGEIDGGNVGVSGSLSGASNLRIRNTGDIHGDTAIAASTTHFVRLLNAGTIEGDNGGVFLNDGVTVHNSGMIDGGSGVGLTFTTGTLFNSGHIHGVGGVVVSDAGGQSSVVVNTGEIEATGAALIDGAGALELDNRGLIIGGVGLGDGNDVYHGEHGQVVGSIGMGAGDDTFFGGDAGDHVTGDNGNDQLNGGKGDDYFDGGAGNDMMNAGGGSDSMYGQAGNDVMGGQTGDDFMYGGDGNDTLVGGYGDDRMNGGAGKDTFNFSGEAGHDVITDFTAAGSTHDQIVLSGLFSTFADLQSHMTQVGADVLIALDADSSVLIDNVTVSALVAADFAFIA